VSVLVLAAAPAVVVTVAALGVSVKPGVTLAPTLSATVCVCAVTPVPLAVIVMFAGDVVTAAPDAAVSVSVVAVTPVPSGEAGLSVAVTPVGRPVTAMATSPVNPPARVIVSGMVVVAPCSTVPVAEPDANVMAGVGAVTPSVTVVVVDVTPLPLTPLARIVIELGVVVAAAFWPAVRVNVDVVDPVAIVAGENDAVTSVGRFSAVSVTGPV
jgi:hypothetical protein